MPKRISWFPFVLSVTLVALVIALPLAAQMIPLRDWAVPASSNGGGKLQIGTNTAGNLVPFNKMTPCRVYDSRVAAGGPGPIASGTSRNIPVTGSPCTGIPANAVAFSLNITVTGSAAGNGNAFVTAYPAGTTRPGVSTVNFLSGSQVANAAIVPAGTGGSAGQIAIYASLATDVIVDINGYFADTPDANYQLYINGNEAGFAAIFGNNSNATAGSHGVGGYESGAGVVHGVQGQVSAAALAGSSGVHGINDSANSTVYGVYGQITPTAAGGFSTAVRGANSGTGGGGIGGWFSHNGTGWGVYASTSGAGLGVYASSNGGTALYATETTGTAVYGSQSSSSAPANSSAIYGATGTSTNNTYGVSGVSNSTAIGGSAGVRGIDPTGAPAWYNATSWIDGGVYGLSKSYAGVFGFSENMGVVGMRENADGTGGVTGFLGWSTYGVYSSGNFGASGTKAFVEPHPTDATQVIRYVSLEGPEAGTYFRGRGRFVNHQAVIQVPESFRIVTDEDGITVNVTPIGGIASVGVMDINLDHIQVESTKDVEFSYVVQGVRKAYKDWVVMGPGDEYRPQGPNARMPSSLSAEAKRRLVANGTYNTDGSVNMATAERVGWAKQWRDEKDAMAKHAEEVSRQQAAEQQRATQQQQQ